MILILILILAGIVSLGFLRSLKLRLKRDRDFQNYFENYWLHSMKRDLNPEEKRLAALSHSFRHFKRILEKEEKKLIKNRIRRILWELRFKDKSSELKGLYRGADRSFKNLLRQVR
jgi:hypothetical protein